MKDERRKHQAVRANKYGQASLEPGPSDITPCGQKHHILEAGEKTNGRKRRRANTGNGVTSRTTSAGHLKWPGMRTAIGLVQYFGLFSVLLSWLLSLDTMLEYALSTCLL